MSASIPFSPGDRVVAYTRYSGGEEQGLKDRSTKEQRDEIAKFCAANGLILERVYEDAAISGTSTAGRDGFHEMIGDLKKPDARKTITGVIIWSLSRFSRNFDDSQFFKAELRRLGYQIYSMSDNIEDTLDGRLLESINDYLNEKYARQVSFDVKRALRSDFVNFGVIPGVPPFGFIRVPVELPPKRDGTKRIRHRWEPDPTQVPFIVRAFEMKASGAAYPEINAELHAYKNASTLAAMFPRPIYYGVMTFMGETKEDYCTPVVSRELWDAANRKVTPTKGTPRMSHVRLLTNFIYCAECGNPMHVNAYNNRGKKYASYRCKVCNAPQIKAETVEDGVIQDLCDNVLTDKEFQRMVDVTDRRRADEASKRAKEENRQKWKRIAVLDEKIDRVTEAIARIGYSEPLMEKLQNLEAQRKVITIEVENRTPDIIVDKFIEAGKALEAILLSQETSMETKREALSFILDRVDLQANRTATIWYHLPDWSTMNKKSPEFTSDSENLRLKQACTQVPPREFESLFEP